MNTKYLYSFEIKGSIIYIFDVLNEAFPWKNCLVVMGWAVTLLIYIYNMYVMKYPFLYLGLSTIGLIAAILGVAILGSLACVAVFVTGPHVKNGLLIFYSGFASFLVAVLASREDHNQKVLSPDIMYIPFIYWILMSSFGLMMVVANAFLMKSIKTSSPNIAVCVTQASYVCLLFTVDAILKSEVILLCI